MTSDCFLHIIVLSRPMCFKALVHAISSICSFCVESSLSLLYLASSYSSCKVHPEFLLPLPKLSPVPLELDTTSSEAPCSSYLIKSLMLMYLGIWRKWTPEVFATRLTSICPISGNSALTFRHHPIPSQSPVVLDHLSQTTGSLKKPDARWLYFLP